METEAVLDEEEGGWSRLGLFELFQLDTKSLMDERDTEDALDLAFLADADAVIKTALSSAATPDTRELLLGVRPL